MPPGSKKVIPWKQYCIGLFVVALLSTVGVVALSLKLKSVSQEDYQEKIAQKRSEDILHAVGKMYELPEEDPQIVLVSDPEAVKIDQPFFENAQKGDIVLIYSKTAILYRERIKKIINVGPVTVKQNDN